MNLKDLRTRLIILSVSLVAAAGPIIDILRLGMHDGDG
jgi:hypothetical protein